MTYMEILTDYLDALKEMEDEFWNNCVFGYDAEEGNWYSLEHTPYVIAAACKYYYEIQSISLQQNILNPVNIDDYGTLKTAKNWLKSSTIGSIWKESLKSAMTKRSVPISLFG